MLNRSSNTTVRQTSKNGTMTEPQVLCSSCQAHEGRRIPGKEEGEGSVE